MVADLQGAFISLAKSVEEDPPTDIENSEVSYIKNLLINPRQNTLNKVANAVL